jgi:hypothetical protein
MPPPLATVAKSPVVDTNILIDFLLWRFHTATQIALDQRLLDQLSAKPLQALSWYLDVAKPTECTFHVIAELRGLKQELPSQTRHSFWRLAQQELSRLGLRGGARNNSGDEP